MQSAFKRNEMISATVAAKNFGKVVSDISAHKTEKTAIVRNNEITAVILPVEEYEYMADVVEFVEHLEMFDMVSKRKDSGGKRVALDELLAEEGVAV